MPARSWAPSSTATCPRSASTCTRGCWPRRWRRRRRSSSSDPPSWPGRRRSSTCPSTPSCRTTTSPDEPAKLELYRRLGRVATESELSAVRGELEDRFGPLPPPVERLLDVARLRFTAEGAGIVSLAREDGQLVVRFPEGWSRSGVLRALAPQGPGDRLPGVPVGRRGRGQQPGPRQAAHGDRRGVGHHPRGRWSGSRRGRPTRMWDSRHEHRAACRADRVLASRRVRAGRMCETRGLDGGCPEATAARDLGCRARRWVCRGRSPSSMVRPRSLQKPPSIPTVTDSPTRSRRTRPARTPWSPTRTQTASLTLARTSTGTG